MPGESGAGPHYAIRKPIQVLERGHWWRVNRSRALDRQTGRCSVDRKGRLRQLGSWAAATPEVVMSKTLVFAGAAGAQATSGQPSFACPLRTSGGGAAWVHVDGEHVRRLRARLESQPAHPRSIQTVCVVSYRFAP